jgi:hypothetical protein
VFPALLTTLRAATGMSALRTTLTALTWTIALLLGSLFGRSRLLLLFTLAHSIRLLPVLLFLVAALILPSHFLVSSAVYLANENRAIDVPP